MRELARRTATLAAIAALGFTGGIIAAESAQAATHTHPYVKCDRIDPARGIDRGHGCRTAYDAKLRLPAHSLTLLVGGGRTLVCASVNWATGDAVAGYRCTAYRGH
jgi:hypothetical protein